jgi:hypothetical protein
MFVERFDITLAVAADGTGTFFSSAPVTGGLVRQVRYVPPDGTNPLATGAVVTLTGEETGLPILAVAGIGTVAVLFAPRQPTHSLAGAANLYGAGGQAVDDLIAIAGERIKVTVSGGGSSNLGTISIAVG